MFLLSEIYMMTGFLILSLIIFIVAKFINEVLTPYSINKELTQKDNFALSISLAGYFFSVVIIFAGSIVGPTRGLIEDFINVGGYALLGIILLNISRIFNDKFILQKFSNVKEIIQNQNAGVATVQMGSYIASALVIAGALSGEGGSLLTLIVFFVLGQVVLLLMAKIYNMITPYDIYDELEKGNVSAGIGFAGTLMAIGIILLSSLAGDFVSWGRDLQSFAGNALIAFIVLPLFRLIFDKVILTNTDLNHEIKNDQNMGAALLEMTVALSFSVILLLVLGS